MISDLRELDYVETTASRLITAHIEQIILDRAVGAIIGPPGIGKTFTATHLRLDDHYSVYVQANTLTEKIKPLLLDISEVLNGQYYASNHRSAHSLWSALGECFRGNNCYLIIDEAQNLHSDNVRTILSWNDAPDIQLPIVFLANREFLKANRSNVSGLDQIFSRGLADRVLTLNATSWRDMESVAFSYDVTGKDALSLLEKRWEEGLDLRRLAAHLKAAKRLANGGPIRLEHLTTALSLLNPTFNSKGAFKVSARNTAA